MSGLIIGALFPPALIGLMALFVWLSTSFNVDRDDLACGSFGMLALLVLAAIICAKVFGR